MQVGSKHTFAETWTCHYPKDALFRNLIPFSNLIIQPLTTIHFLLCQRFNTTDRRNWFKYFFQFCYFTIKTFVFWCFYKFYYLSKFLLKIDTIKPFINMLFPIAHIKPLDMREHCWWCNNIYRFQ